MTLGLAWAFPVARTYPVIHQADLRGQGKTKIMISNYIILDLLTQTDYICACEKRGTKKLD